MTSLLFSILLQSQLTAALIKVSAARTAKKGTVGYVVVAHSKSYQLRKTLSPWYK